MQLIMPITRHFHQNSCTMICSLFALHFYVFALGVSALASTAQTETVGSIFSRETGRFLEFLEDGTVTANGDYGTPTTDLYIHYFPNNELRIQSITMAKVCFLVHDNGRIWGSTPMNGNEMFKLEFVGLSSIALRLINYSPESGSSSGSGSGSGSASGTVADEVTEDEAAAPVCYLGFPDKNSEPQCYSSSDYAATRFTIIHI